MGSAQERNVRPMRDSLSCHAKELEHFLKGSGNQRFFKIKTLWKMILEGKVTRA